MQEYPCGTVRSNVDWSSFPPDLLFLICQKLHCLPDFIRFRAVCKNWHLSAPHTVSPPHLPWLIKFYYHDNHACMYSLSSRKIYTVEVPQEVKQKKLMGPGQTYVLAHDLTNNSLSLFNPLNGEEHPLPPLPIRLRKNEYFYPLCLGPSRTKDCIILLHRTHQIFTFCKTNGEKWAMLDLKCETSLPIACAFYNGMYFVTRGRGEPTNIINADTGQVVSIIEPPPGYPYSDYLVESFGDILRVQVYFGSQLLCHIYRLDYGGDNCRWIEMRSIGDRILFLSMFLAFHLRGFSCKATGSKGNCIYLQTFGLHENNHCGLCRYDIEDKKTESLPYTPESLGFWFGGVWFTSSLR